MVILIITCIVISLICFLILKGSNTMAKQGNLSPTPIIYLNGCLGYQSGVKIKIQSSADKIVIDGKYQILVKKVSEVKIVKTKQLTEKQKNIIGHAIIGILIAGGIGGIIGSISGVGSNKKTEDIEILYITYRDINEFSRKIIFSK